MEDKHQLIKELLILYADDMVGEETKRIMEQHLRSCDECRHHLEEIKVLQQADIPEDGYVDHPSANGKEPGFIQRIKRLGLLLGSATIILIIIFALGSWMVGRERAEAQLKEEKRAHDQELVKIDSDLISLSPSQEEIYRRTGLGIRFQEKHFTQQQSVVTYSYEWNNPSIDYVLEDIYWPNHLVAMDLTNNEIIGNKKNTRTTGSDGNQQSWILEGIQDSTRWVGIDLPSVGIFFKPPQVSINLHQVGETPIQQEITVNEVKFLIEKAEVTENTIKIHYHQLDKISEKGLYQLSFTIQDANQKNWNKEPYIDFQVGESRVAEIPMYKEMEKPLTLQLEHAVLIVPGMHYKFSIDPS